MTEIQGHTVDSWHKLTTQQAAEARIDLQMRYGCVSWIHTPEPVPCLNCKKASWGDVETVFLGTDGEWHINWKCDACKTVSTL